MNKNLVLLTDEVPEIIYDLRYTSNQNILGEPITDIPPILDAEAARSLRAVVAEFGEDGYRVVVWDAFRLPEVQAKLRAFNTNEKYVKTDSNHIKGLAVDVTLQDATGSYLDMGTDFDDFSPKSHTDCTDLTIQQLQNRILLQRVMSRHGFKVWPYEWWHFDYVGSSAV